MPSRIGDVNESRRRSRSVIENESDADNTRSLGSVKRHRTNGYRGDFESESPGPSFPNGSANGNESEVGEGGFQPGAIVRVKVTNFVTYENAEFFPGPNLNMVIGPNGTGKSSLVCAICLGLGWPPACLGRAQQIGEFVKYGMKDAFVEVELQRRSNEDTNHIVKLRIIKDGDKREFWWNNKKVSLKAIQLLTKSLSIQIDNLCQFLPQDKVSEFAALSPIDLLQQTQRAAAPEQMLEWHVELKQYRKDQKSLQLHFENDKAQLENLQTRQTNLRVEVDRLKERKEVEKNVKLLEQSIPFVEYRAARTKYADCKARKKDAQKRVQDLEKEVAPIMESVNLKKEYARQIAAGIMDYKKDLQRAERAAQETLASIEGHDAALKDRAAHDDAERAMEEKRRQDLSRIQKRIDSLERDLRAPAVEFDAASFNERIVSVPHLSLSD